MPGISKYQSNLADLKRFVSIIESSAMANVKMDAIDCILSLGHLARGAVPALESLVKDYNHDLSNYCRSAIDIIMTMDLFPDSVPCGDIVESKMESEEDMAPQDDLSCEVLCTCGFCGKDHDIRGRAKHVARLSGPNEYYCHFCLRNGFNGRNGRNVLILTFRAVFGYYFYALYALPKSPFIYISQIQDLIDLHRKVGEANPVFHYDPESFCWFVDFSRVGETKRKLPLRNVLETIVEIILALNMQVMVPSASPAKLYEKYREAIQCFSSLRQRPPGQRLLAPTMYKTGASEYAAEPYERVWRSSYNSHDSKESRKVSWPETRAFTPSVLDSSLCKRG